MAEVDAQAYAVTSGNAAAGASNSVETQQPGGSGALRQTMVLGDPTTRANMAKVDGSGNLAVAGGSTNAGGTSGSTTFTAADIVVPSPDGTGLLVSGTPTAGSVTSAFTVADGLVASLFLIKGLTANQTTITIYFEASANSTNGTDGDWIELKQRRTGTQPGVEATDYKTQANGYFRGNCAGFKWLRARLVGTFAAGVSAQIWTSAGQSATFFNSGLPGSNSTIGAVKSAIVQSVTTNLTALNQAQTITLQGEAGMTTQLSGVWTGTVTFEASNDNVNWTTINVQRAGDNTISQTVVNSTNNDIYRIGVAGFLYVRARCSAFTSGTIAVTSSTAMSAATALLTAPLPTGTNIVGAVKSAIVQSAITNLTALNQAQTFTMQGEAGMTTQLTGVWTATVTFEASNDNTNWTTINVQRAGDNTITQTVVNSTNNDVYRLGVSGFMYVRIRCSAFTSGTIVVTSSTSPNASTAILTASLPAGTANIGAFSLTPTTGSTGGYSPYFASLLVAPAGGVTISAVAGKFGGYMIQNLNSTPAYLQCFDTTAAVTLGTTVPTFVIPIPANGTPANGMAANVEFTVGINLANGLKVAATTTSTGATAVTTGLTGVILYK
jgi:hypothetical protein